MTQQLHPAQLSTLYLLRRTPTARFSALMQPSGLQSDTFKFHLRKLVAAGYVQKRLDGAYELTAEGKEFSNNLNYTTRSTQRQPKLSIILFAAKTNSQGETLYLLHQRQRNPFFGYWGFISGPVQWGESFETAASKELAKQTGLAAACAVRSFYRESDYQKETNELLEDKLFAVVEATSIQGTLTNTWSGGRTAWMTLAELETQPKFFSTTTAVIKMVQDGPLYTSHEVRYSSEEY